MIGITIASPKYAEIAEEARSRFSRYTGLNCLVFHTQHESNYTVKLQLWKLFKETNQSFCFFDCDNFCVRDCDLSEFENKTEFIAVKDSDGHKLNPSNFVDAFSYKDCVTHNLDPSRYFNGGFFIANSKYHQKVFETALGYIRNPKIHFDDFGEQSALNLAVRDTGTELKLISVDYNAVVGGSVDMIKDVCPDPYFIHAAGMELKYKIDHLKYQEKRIQESIHLFDN